MFCSQCGKKVNDTMLFCPFCGAALVLPEQDDRPQMVAPPAPPEQDDRPQRAAPPAPPEQGDRPQRVAPPAPPEQGDRPLKAAAAEDTAAEDVPFEPLDLDALAEPVVHHTRTEMERRSESPAREPVRLSGSVPDLTGGHAPVRRPARGAKKRPSTYVPQKEFNPNDLFMDGDEDDFIPPDEPEAFSFEDEPEDSFFVRHMRGMVGVMAFAILMIVLLLWALSASGQRALAGLNLAWRAEAYEQIAYEAYENQNYPLSLEYYLKALSREPDSYNYAYSAGIMYLYNNDPADASEMAKRAIQIDSASPQAYALLVQIYPDVSTRPWEIQQLIEQGYQEPGSEQSNPNS